MTNEDIDRLLFFLDDKGSDCERTIELLLEEKRKNNDKNRQEAFMDYIDTRVISSKNRKKFTPILSYSDENVMFANGISLYIVKSQFLKPSIEELDSNIKRKKFKLVPQHEMNVLLVKIERFYGKNDELCDLWYDSSNTVETEFNYIGKLYTDHFRAKEIDMCNRILNEPIYKNSIDSPILKAESEIGKAYILGRKRCQN